MQYTVNMSQEILERYIMLLGKLTDKEPDAVDEKVEEFTCEVGPTIIHVLPCSNKTISITITVKDELILDMLDIADKYTDAIKKIAGSIVMLGKGMFEITGMKKEMMNTFKKYED